MSKKIRGDFDDDEGFFESLMNRKESVPMPDSMVKLLKGAVAFSVLVIVGLLGWAVWPNGERGADDSVPIIRAESDEYKVRPEDKGGMIIPNKDSTIFETMSSDAQSESGSEKKVESLLEDSEQPLKKEDVFVEDKPAVSAEKTNDDSVPPSSAPSSSELTSVKEDTVEKDSAKDQKTDVIDVLKAEAGTKDMSASKQSIAKKEEKTSAKQETKGSVYIQLAAVKSEGDAKTKWDKLKSSYPSLNSLSLKVEKADLGAKGIFYRVQAGPTSAANAATLCTKIKAAKGDCLIIK